MQSTCGQYGGENKAYCSPHGSAFFSWEPSGPHRQQWKAQSLRVGARQSLNYRGWLLQEAFALLWGLRDAPFPPLPSASARIKACGLHNPTDSDFSPGSHWLKSH